MEQCKKIHLTVTELQNDVNDICCCGKKLNRILHKVQSNGAKHISVNCNNLAHIEIECDVPLDKLENFS